MYYKGDINKGHIRQEIA